MTKMTSVCPECGTENIIQDIGRYGLGGRTHFCNMMCERNYRYRMRHKDPITGNVPSPKDAKKL